MDVDLHFGCSIFGFNNPGGSDMEQIMELFTQLSTDLDDPKWESHNSFFMTLSADFNLDFTTAIETNFNPFKGMFGIPDDLFKNQGNNFRET